MFYSAEMDIMNPQAEIYATVGNYDDNPNEMKATVTAFIIPTALSVLHSLRSFPSAAMTV